MVRLQAGQQVGGMKVLRIAGSNKRNKKVWLCLCLCGKEFLTEPAYLMRRESCGKCEWHVHHKDAYISWMGMKTRCKTPTSKDYKRYGARGITYDSRWEKFTEFFKDMGDPPKDVMTGERLSLDREDNNGNYCKENCKWSYRSEQQLNKS